MDPVPEALRGSFKISQLCQVFEATLHLCMEEGFPRHQLHYFPSPVILEDCGRKLILPEPQLGCIFGLTRFSPLNIPNEDRVAFAHRPPFETLFLAMPVSEGKRIISQRTRFLQESENQFLDLQESRERIFIVAASHRRLIHGRIMVRHQPAALFGSDGKILWLHPAAPRFGLLQVGFPRSQQQRHLDSPNARAQEHTQFQTHDEAGLPAWYGEVRQNMREDGEDDPMTDALLGLQARSLLQVSIEKEAEERMRAIAQEFLFDFETFFGMGGLMPVPGILDFA